ncbi:MAG: DUF3427 domain-containing protein [Bacilli bacterium]|nr:DUF3427 domain-containing protein [Bacilli bacterium]MDD4077498.1 DUF3427 domain-containing protein [Bacilli bacterium]MDD4387992.1 DUF3427 domain-containing protein [Bacilli bacterium]
MKGLFLSNTTETTFLDKIIQSLNDCISFSFSVSFIKRSGFILILPAIHNALIRGAKGKFIVSTYQNFTDIPALQELFKLVNTFTNFECHIDYNSFPDRGFHTKGYIFEYFDCYEIVIGSSNLTRYALLKNIEWNIAFSAKDALDYYRDIIDEYDFLWNNTYPLNREIIDKYSIQLEYAIEKWDMDYFISYETKIMPNYMQRKALKEIRRYRDMGVDKALVIAATGSGKTYLAAFDVRNFDAKRLLFVVHRDTILKKAMETFNCVFENRVTYGFFTGNDRQYDSDFVFATNLTISKNLDLFTPDEFDYIVIDEVHHAVAGTYQKIINYFMPRFLLGLTATPDRMDDKSVYDLFGRNVPYELRLREALENDLVVPFKYYGIKDRLVDYSEKDARVLIQQIATDIHCEFIKENIEKYRPQDTKLKALAFCRSIEHCRMMSENIRVLGYHTRHLSGRSETGERLQAFRELQSEESLLEIIFTVDLLNEGVDIPAVNMVLFLRPTESATVFIQQLGRGLRKHEGKEYLTVLDFIGNSYTRSVQIALALGSLAKNAVMERALLVSLIRDDFRALGLPIEIHLDEQSKEEILNHINQTNFNRFEFLKKDYENFKYYCGTAAFPYHIDYLNREIAPDLMRFINSRCGNRKVGCYYNFLLNVGEDIPFFNTQEITFLTYLSRFLPLVRPYEYYIIQLLVEGVKEKKKITDAIKERYDYFDGGQFTHAVKLLTNSLWDDPVQNKQPQYVKAEAGLFSLDISLENKAFVEHLSDLLAYGLERYNSEFSDFSGRFKQYANYKTDQIKMMMKEKSLTQQQGTIVKKDGTVYILAGLNKDKTILEHLKYNNRFLNSKVFQWESTTNVRFDNQPGQKLVNSKLAHVFVRKTANENGITLPYTYFGTGRLAKPRSGTKSKDTLIFDILLDNEVPEYMRFDFMIPNNKN